jgi:integrase
MSKNHSTVPIKPSKPYPEFPLYAHAAGYWAKKIRGRFYYFGPWEDPDGALTKYEEQKGALHSGKSPKPDSDATTVKDICNTILNAKKALVESQELSPRSWEGYKNACDVIIKHFGKRQKIGDLTPEDFTSLRKKLAVKWGPVRLGNTIQTIRGVFKFAYDSGMLETPMRFGPTFKKPTKKIMRLHRAKQGLKLFSADEIKALLSRAGDAMKAMILLGVNCGFGNADCARLPLAAVDFRNGWIDYPRPKTGINRRCSLWPETATALREVIANRKSPKKDADKGLLFITQRGQAWTGIAAITHEMGKLLKALGINSHRNFYTLRHTFRTIADESKDQPAIDHIMGHARDDMASVYRERISDDRLMAVSDHVRKWLFKDTSRESSPSASGELQDQWSAI